MKKSINENALIVNIRVSQWSGKKIDRTVSNEVNKSHNADKSAGKYLKNLVDPNKLKAITSQSGKIRRYVSDMTMAWGENGERLLSAKLYFKFMEGLQKMQSEFYQLTEEFVEHYEKEREASKARLGSMFNPNEYPEKHEISDKFSINLDIMPIPEGQVITELPSDVEEGLNKKIQTEIYNRHSKASKEVLERVKGLLVQLRDKMMGDSKRVHESTFSNLLEFAELMPEMNVWDDPNINELSLEIKNSITETASSVRGDDVTKGIVANKSEKIIDKLDSYL